MIVSKTKLPRFHHLGRLAVSALFASALCLGVHAAPAQAEDPKPKPPAQKPPAPKPPAAKAPAKPAPAKPPAPKPEAKPPAPPPRPFEFHNDQLIEDKDGRVTYFYRTNFATPQALQASLRLMGVTGDGKGPIPVRLQAFAQQNQLLIQGLPEDVEILLDMIGYFDVSAPQVYIETKVVEITWDSNFEFGLDHIWDRSMEGPTTLFRGSSSVLNPPSFLRSTFPPGFPFQGVSSTWGFTGKNAERFGPLEVTIQAMQINGKAEVLSKPSIIATQGIQAQVQTSETTPIARFDNASGNATTVTNQTYRFDRVDAGVTLTVKPTHIGEGFVTLELNPVVKGIQGQSATRINETFVPITTSRSAKTTVTLADGETMVIGGLYTSASTKQIAKTPIISDLPLVGELFTRTRETKQKTELVFILTPRIMRKQGDLKIVVPESEIQRLESLGDEEGDGKCKTPVGPFGIRKPGAYLDELDD
ncbi:MAG: hypothetical protein QNJ98_13080 [Planctomycetota bacterium]|nr:hypothetical protein [Planctomycetota bacterium]